MSRFIILKNSRFQDFNDFKISRFQGFEVLNVSRFQVSKVSRFQDFRIFKIPRSQHPPKMFKISRTRDFNVSIFEIFQDFKSSSCLDVKVSHDFKIFKISIFRIFQNLMNSRPWKFKISTSRFRSLKVSCFSNISRFQNVLRFKVRNMTTDPMKSGRSNY